MLQTRACEEEEEERHWYVDELKVAQANILDLCGTGGQSYRVTIEGCGGNPLREHQCAPSSPAPRIRECHLRHFSQPIQL